MAAFAISVAEKRLLHHLQVGGSVQDEVGRQLVGRFAHKMWAQSEIKSILTQYEFTLQEIALMYAETIHSLMPNPCIEKGGPLLVPTLFFMEPHRLENLLLEVRRDTKGLSQEQRLSVLVERSTFLARLTQEANDEAKGRYPFKVEGIGGLKSASGGCASRAIGAVVVFGAFLFVLNRLFEVAGGG